jgi:hypothetical protein
MIKQKDEKERRLKVEWWRKEEGAWRVKVIRGKSDTLYFLCSLTATVPA